MEALTYCSVYDLLGSPYFKDRGHIIRPATATISLHILQCDCGKREDEVLDDGVFRDNTGPDFLTAAGPM